jgi:hypothetical protein
MTRSWAGPEYNHFSGELATAYEREFERRALPLIRMIYPGAIGAPQLLSLDRAGIDLLLWSDVQPFPLVAQCKGFKPEVQELGESEVKQCLKSIEAFRKSEFKADHYVLIHNRTGKSETFRIQVQEELQQLVESGHVKRADLWDRHLFLRAVFNSMLERVRSAMLLGGFTAAEFLEHQLCEPLEHVPFRVSDLTYSPYRLEQESEVSSMHSDPAEALLDFDASNLSLLIGEAGYGKTTAALRAFVSTEHQCFYVPAATISGKVVGTKDLLAECVKLDELFAEIESSDWPTAQRLVRPVVEYIFKDRTAPVVLILDGLDESVYFTRRGGLQALFNQLHQVLVPVLLTARSELWHSRQQDFAASFGESVPKGKGKLRRIRSIELLPWTTTEIENLARRYSDTLRANQRERLEELLATIRSGEYETLYGDIPRRPLFLRFILETVAEQGVRRTGRAALFYDWARMKVQRDITQPRKWGGEGRAPIGLVDESTDMAVRLSFIAMMLAAFQMSQVVDGVLELLPSCTLDEVLLSDNRLSGIGDPIGLFLNSLLAPGSVGLAHKPLEVRFAHRAYQEFFLSLFVGEHPERFEGITLPAAVREHLSDLESEGIGTKP